MEGVAAASGRLAGAAAARAAVALHARKPPEEIDIAALAAEFDGLNHARA
jgi:beta-N-acetylhexosaminidase